MKFKVGDWVFWEYAKAPSHLRTSTWCEDFIGKIKNTNIHNCEFEDPISGLRGNACHTFRAATKQEIKEHLIKEAKRRGFIRGFPVTYKSLYNYTYKHQNIQSFSYNLDNDELIAYFTDGGHNPIYCNGKWSKTIHDIQKEHTNIHKLINKINS